MIFLAISRCQGSNLQLMCPLYYRELSWGTLYFKTVCATAGLKPAITGMGKFYVRRLDHSAKLLCYSETSTFAYIKCCIHFYCILQTNPTFLGFKMSKKNSSLFWLRASLRPRISQSNCFKSCIRHSKSLDFHWIYEASSGLLEFCQDLSYQECGGILRYKKTREFYILLGHMRFKLFYAKNLAYFYQMNDICKDFIGRVKY